MDQLGNGNPPDAAGLATDRVVLQVTLASLSRIATPKPVDGALGHERVSPHPADGLIRTAREIVTMTFSEMYSEDQHEAVLHRIRSNIWDVLPPFNEYLTAIEIEPIAAKVLPDQPPSP